MAAVAIIVALSLDAAVPTTAIVRPLLVALTVTLAVQFIASLLTRNAMIGAYVALVPILVLVGIEAVLIGVGVVAVPLVVASARRRRLAVIDWRFVTRALNVSSAALLAISLASSFAGGAFSLPARSSSPIVIAPLDLPDIFVILLDAHPRADTLAAQFDIDNSSWLAAMKGSGFDVATNSRSNYNLTQLTLPSVFAFQHVLEQPGIRPDVSPADQWRSLTRALNRARGLDALHAAGYEITTITSPSESTALTAADVVIDGDEVGGFENTLLARSLVRHIMPDVQRQLVADQYRDALSDDFDMLEQLGTPADHPRFVFAHIFAPHPPFVFDADGRAQGPAPCFPESCQLWDSGYRGDYEPVRAQLRGFVEWTDDHTLDAVRAIQAKAKRPPVIVVFSDHGLRHDPRDRAEVTSSLFASSTPGRPGLFPDDTTPINILPRLLNAYAGTSLPLATEDIYWTDMVTMGATGPLTLVPLPVSVP